MSQPTPRLYWAPGYTWQTPDVDIVWEEIEVASGGDGLYPDEGITTSRGRESLLDQFEAGELSATLVNIGRTFDPRYPSSPYVGKLLPGVPIKLTGQPEGEAEADVWRGTISGFPQHRDGPWATVPLQAFGLFDKVARASLPPSVYEHEVLADTPLAYWKLDDSDRDIMSDSSGWQNDGIYTNQETADPVRPYGSTGATYFSHTGQERGQFIGSLDSTPPMTFEAWGKYPSDNTIAHAFITAHYDTTFNTRVYMLGLYTIAGIVPGTLGVIITGPNASDTTVIGGNDLIDDDTPHHLVIAYNSVSNLDIYVDGVLQTESTAMAGATALPTSEMQRWGVGNVPVIKSGEAGLEGAMSDAAVYSGALSAARVLAHYNAGAAPLDGQRSDERIEWIADEVVGLPADRLNLELGQSILGPAEFEDTGFVLDYWRLVEQSEYGRLFEDKEGRIRFLDRYWGYTETEVTTSQLTFTDDPNGSGVYHVASDPTLDDELVINVLSVSRRGGSEIVIRDETSKAVYGELAGEPMTGLLLQTDTEVRSLGEHIVGIRSTPQPRIPSLRVPLHHLDPADATAVFNLEIGYRISVERNPLIGDPETLDYIIEKFDDEITPGEWWRELYVSPAPSPAAPDTEWIWDTSRWGIDTRWAPVLSIGYESALFVWDESAWDYTTRWAF